MNRLKIEIYFWIEAILSPIPGFLGVLLRRYHYGFWFGKVGSAFKIGLRSKIQQPWAVYIGDNVSFNDEAWIAANKNNGQIFIGNNTIIGPRCILHSGNHIFDSKLIPIRKQGHKFAQIKIENNVWLASNVTVLKGVTIKTGAVVAAGAVVIKDVDEYTIVGGVPAKLIGKRQ